MLVSDVERPRRLGVLRHSGQAQQDFVHRRILACAVLSDQLRIQRVNGGPNLGRERDPCFFEARRDNLDRCKPHLARHQDCYRNRGRVGDLNRLRGGRRGCLAALDDVAAGSDVSERRHALRVCSLLSDLIAGRIAKRYQNPGDGFPASIFGRSVDGRRQHRSCCKAGGKTHGQWP